MAAPNYLCPVQGTAGVVVGSGQIRGLEVDGERAVRRALHRGVAKADRPTIDDACAGGLLLTTASTIRQACSGLWCAEYVTKRTEKLSFWRPVGDGEESMGKRPAKFVFESIAEVQSGVPGGVAEGSAAPRA